MELLWLFVLRLRQGNPCSVWRKSKRSTAKDSGAIAMPWVGEVLIKINKVIAKRLSLTLSFLRGVVLHTQTADAISSQKASNSCGLLAGSFVLAAHTFWE